MKKQTKLVWRLGKLPSVEELRELVKDKIITNEEAREILFNQEVEEEKDQKSLEAEVKFLRELVETLSKKNPTGVVETIRYIERPYYHWGWHNGYIALCSNLTNNTANTISGGIGNSTGTTLKGALQTYINNSNNC